MNIQCGCNNAFTASLDDKGNLIYKADESKLFKQDKKTLKKKYHDLPRFAIIVEMEDAYKKNIDTHLINMAKQVATKLKQLANVTEPKQNSTVT